jgi:proline iminopeptidase
MDHRYLLHGLEPLAGELELVFYDQRGVGESTSRLVPELHTLERYVDDLEALRLALDLDSFLLLGHSWGGVVAMAYAAAHPEAVDGLVLVSTMEPGARFAAALRDALARRVPAERRTALAALRDSEPFRSGQVDAVERALREGFRAGMARSALADQMILDLHPRTARDGGRVVALLFRDPSSLDLWPRLGRIAAPTLVVHGRHDATPAAMAAELAAAIDGAELVMIDDAGHFPYLESPETFLASIRAFLDGVAPAPRVTAAAPVRDAAG